MAAPSLDVALENLTTAVGSIKALVGAVSFIIGISLVWRGIAMYRSFANQTFGSAQRGEFAGPLVFIVVGAILIYLPSASDVALFTIFSTTETGSESEMLAYFVPGAEERWKNIALVLVKYMKLIGFIAFVRGWIILSKMGHAGSQPGSVAKGLTHLIGGVLLMNIPDTMRILATTFGFA